MRRRPSGWGGDLDHLDAIAEGHRARAADILDDHLRWALCAKRGAVRDRHVGARCRTALVEHGIDEQLAAAGCVGASRDGHAIACDPVGHGDGADVVEVSGDCKIGIGARGKRWQRVAYTNQAFV